MTIHYGLKQKVDKYYLKMPYFKPFLITLSNNVTKKEDKKCIILNKAKKQYPINHFMIILSYEPYKGHF